MQSAQVWVAGEALIDLLPSEVGPNPVVGGGPANTAKALANLGLPVAFVGGISSDGYGGLIEAELEKYGVDLALARSSSLPTAIAKVSLDENGSATYEFKLEGTATFDFGSWLPEGKPAVLHVGTLATIVEPGASALFEWAKRLSVPIVFDPNIRTSVLSDREKYRSYFEKWVGISKVVKLSDADLKWLEYSIEEILKLGAFLVVLTKGDAGISGHLEGEVIDVPAVKVTIVDTVGAGDTVGAIVVEALAKNPELSGETLKRVLERAATAAAITCSRAGAKPPTRSELS